MIYKGFFISMPGVLDSETQAGWEGGFDLVLGNPPWDTLNPEVKSFFGAYEPAIRSAPKTEQDLMVTELLEIPEVAARWKKYQQDLYSSVHFMKLSGRYHLFAQGHLGKGGFNAYRMFVETATQLTRTGGSAAQVVPSGFCGGANASAIRRELYEHWQLSYVLGFINTTGAWFPGVHRDTSFCLYVGRKGTKTDIVAVAFEIRAPADLARVLTR